MNLVANNSSFTVDYGLNTAAGDSRYIVNTQLVKYGQINFDNDVAIEEIVSPSYSAVHYRKTLFAAILKLLLRIQEKPF